MKSASIGAKSAGGGNHNRIILSLFIVLILLFGLLAGLYVVNERITIQNKAAEPVISQIVPSESEKPYIECRWKGEEDVEYSYRIIETDPTTGEEVILPEGTISLDDGPSSGTDGIETSSTDNMLSVIYRNLVEGKLYKCEVFVGGPKCGEATYVFSKEQITLTATPTGSAGGPTGSVTPTDTSSTLTATVTPADSSTSDDSSSSLSSGGSGSGASGSGSSGTGSSGSGSGESSSFSGSTGTPTPSSTIIQVESGDSDISEASDSADSEATGSSQTSKGGLTAIPTTTPAPPVSGIAGLSLFILLGGLLIIAFGLLLR